MSSGPPPPPRYVRVYQTWNLVQALSSRNADLFTPSESASSTPAQHLRHRAQIARVERGLSLQQLACDLDCPLSLLAAFERGEEVLSSELQCKLMSILDV